MRTNEKRIRMCLWKGSFMHSKVHQEASYTLHPSCRSSSEEGGYGNYWIWVAGYGLRWNSRKLHRSVLNFDTAKGW